MYRDFTRVGAGKMPDAKTMGRWGWRWGPRWSSNSPKVVKLAQANGLAAGRRMRVDTTVVETNVHYPTDSSLLGDGVRVLIRTMKRIGKIAGETGAKLRDRSRSVKLRVLDIARAARSRPSRAGRSLIDPMASCSMRPAEWWDRRNGSPKRSPKERSAQGTACSSWCSKACAKSSTRWCRWSSK